MVETIDRINRSKFPSIIVLEDGVWKTKSPTPDGKMIELSLEDIQWIAEEWNATP